MRAYPSLIRFLSAALVALAGFGSATAAVFNVRNYGATGDGRTNDTRAIQAAIDAAGQAGGGEVYFPDGNYRSVRLTLRSNLVVNVSPGAVILASPVSDDWSQLNLATLIYARKADKIALEGGGTLDGGGLSYYDSAGNFAPGNRPQTVINILDSTNITIRNLTLRNSTRWTVVLDGVVHSLVDHVTIRNREFGLSRESDGIDLNSCQHAVVQNCDIETGDDGICLKPQNKHGAFDMHDILVQDCTVASTCNAVKIGTGTSTNLYDVHCRNITVNRHSRIHSKGNPIKTDSHGSENGSCIAAIAVESNDGGSVHDITYENFTINDCDTPIFVEVENRQTYLKHDSIGTVYNITFSNITCRSSARASQINDQIPGRFRNLTFNNLDIHSRETYDGNSSPLHLAGGYPDAQKCGRMPAYGLFARDVDGLNFTGTIIFHDDGNSHRPAFASENVSVTGTKPH